MTTYQNNQIRSPKVQITETIDQILNHHYFHSKLDQIIANKKVQYDTGSVSGLLDDQYFKAQEEVVHQIVDIVHGVVDAQLREVLTHQFINVGQQIQGIKHQMYIFMEEQSKKVIDIKSQMNKLNQQMKRRASTTQAMSNTTVINSSNYTGGIRFYRSGVSSQIQSSGTISNQNEGKSFHTELASLKKQFDDLKQSLQRGEPMKLIQQQFNQFKIETKVALESLKHSTKKLSVDLGSLSKSSNNSIISAALKQNIQSCVKRTIGAQLKVYGSYSEQILHIKDELQKFDDKLINQADTYNEYLSNQLKSVWVVLNDMKINLDDVIENVGLNTSREIL